MFGTFGWVGEVFLPKKRDKWNHRFEFVKFKEVADVGSLEGSLEASLEEVWWGNVKLKVNKARFGRDEREEGGRGNEGEGVVRGQKVATVVEGEGRGQKEAMVVEGLLFCNVATGRREEEVASLDLFSSEEMMGVLWELCGFLACLHRSRSSSTLFHYGKMW